MEEKRAVIYAWSIFDRVLIFLAIHRLIYLPWAVRSNTGIATSGIRASSLSLTIRCRMIWNLYSIFILILLVNHHFDPRINAKIKNSS
jgi:hypothetical protein